MSDSGSNKGSSTLEKVEAVATGMGEGYFKSQSEDDQKYQKYAAESIGTAVGNVIYK